MIPNVEFRRRALAALKPVLPIALLVSLCAELPSLLAQVAGVLTQQPLTQILYSYMESDPTLYAPEKLLADLSGAVTPGMIAAWGGTVLAFILTPFLNLGRLSYTLDLLRGQSGDVSSVLSRAPQFLKALGLRLLIVLKELAWSLPGFAVMGVGIGLLFAFPSVRMLNVFSVVYFAGFILAMALMIRASFHYYMAELFMADQPDIGIRAAIRRSVDMMRYRKMLLFSLMVTFFLWLLLCGFAQSFVESISPIIGMTLGMAARLLISVYMQTSIAAFYEAYKDKPSV